MLDMLLCLFNIHNWGYSKINGYIVIKRCSRCNKEAVYEQDTDHSINNHNDEFLD